MAVVYCCWERERETERERERERERGGERDVVYLYYRIFTISAFRYQSHAFQCTNKYFSLTLEKFCTSSVVVVKSHLWMYIFSA